jgi:hypothetical protein
VRRKDALGNLGRETGSPAAGPGAHAEASVAWRTLLGAISNLETLRRPQGRWWPFTADDSYLVDSASSHMLVLKIKPCMSKYKHLYCETANGSLYKLSFI